MTRAPKASLAARFQRHLSEQASHAAAFWMRSHEAELRPLLKAGYGRWTAIQKVAAEDGVKASRDAFRKAWQQIEGRRAARGVSGGSAPEPPWKTEIRHRLHQAAVRDGLIAPSESTHHGTMWTRMEEEAGVLPRPIRKSTDKRGDKA